MNIEQLRADTPAVAHLIHFNNAGAALMPSSVISAMTRHIQLEASLGGYEAAAQQSAQVENVYGAIGRLINAEPDEIAVIENATRAWDMAFYSLPLQPGDVVLTSTTEYAGNYIPYLQMKQRRGIEIRLIPNDEHGQVSLSALRELLHDERVALVSLPVIATNGGPVQPIEQIGALARAAGVLFLLDACQGVGQMPIDVQKIGCHMLAATSRKYLRGPRGMGFLYVEKALCQNLEPAFLDLHAAALQSADTFTIRADARRFENWECNVAAKLGLGAAVEYALAQGIEPMWLRIQQLAGYLRQRLAELSGVTPQDLGRQKSGIVTFTHQNHSAAQVQQWLAGQEKPVNVSTSTFRSTLLDMQHRELLEVSRASVHAYNTEAEIDTMIAALSRLS
ncbi:aminotransferase class V-fold PLP-dependent enzyme [Pseudomonas sp. BCA14]|uniref:aminotransferase class V-fold PLP-dependent enzyme n=1 Tax=unclassified Pseudomonas TaxID=196821 RepID=UPI00106ECC1A|nr:MULTISPECIES: aminotransferase class V-fold PLP-dependent enzyme [unclassified Pseudomonas]TFF13542.1 aminotransferase class V-fold PLP-dependent enzyme [Pseudomonas sp. JMN1]TFF15774.1 aminotransferase class V-fold PLP-dependent enzyme [Pseudomonas sp. BCA17]TFF30552.1 aminotransferase class V-fold PLP-dependent enzyme [Pseudomonas sp. BCA14]TFF33134.1 aminotransferase class V-fold PLP-dependent enzyme [Pseudomonas sp. BCA13]